MQLIRVIFSLCALLSTQCVLAAPTPKDSGVKVLLRETGRNTENWHFGMSLRMPGAENDITHEYVIRGAGMVLDQRSTKARKTYPVEGSVYFAQGATTPEEVKEHVEAIISQIPQPIPIPPSGSYENCLDCAKHGFEALHAAGFISSQTLSAFQAFYHGNEAKVHQLTDDGGRVTHKESIQYEKDHGLRSRTPSPAPGHSSSSH